MGLKRPISRGAKKQLAALGGKWRKTVLLCASCGGKGVVDVLAEWICVPGGQRTCQPDADERLPATFGKEGGKGEGEIGRAKCDARANDDCI